MISKKYGERAAHIADLEQRLNEALKINRVLGYQNTSIKKKLEDARNRNHELVNQFAAYQCLLMDVLEVLPVTDENRALIELVKRAADGEVVTCEQQS